MLTGPIPAPRRSLVATASACLCSAALCVAAPTPPVFAEGSATWPDDPVATRIVQRLAAARQAAGAPPLAPEAAVQAAAELFADDVTAHGTWRGLDLSVERSADFLQSRGYVHQELVTSYFAPATLELRPTELRPTELRPTEPRPTPEQAALWVEDWLGRSPTTFERLCEPDLRHFGIARGDAAGQPFYALVGAVSKAVYWSEQTADLQDVEAVRRRILESVNRARRESGLPPLVRRAELERAAQDYADAMLAGDFYGHVAPDGRGVRNRVDATGYKPRRLAENLASGQSSVEQVMQGWLDSPGHRANILHRRLRELGVGMALGEKNGEFKILWVQVFAGKP